MSSSDDMFETFLQYVNERAAHVKIDRDSSRCQRGK